MTSLRSSGPPEAYAAYASASPSSRASSCSLLANASGGRDGKPKERVGEELRMTSLRSSAVPAAYAAYPSAPPLSRASSWSLLANASGLRAGTRRLTVNA
jgi:hypothetical protein